MSRTAWFRGRAPREQSTKDRFYAWDIECAGLNPNDPLIIAVVPFERFSSRTPSEWVFRAAGEFREWLADLPTGFNHIFYAHNGSRFDNYSVFTAEQMRDAKKFERDGTIFWIQLRSGVEFRDSRNVLPVALKALGAKGVTPAKFIDEGHPDYGDPDAITEEDVEYCVQDCRVLRDALESARLLYGEWVGVPNPSLPLTTAGMAHRVWTSLYWPDEWTWTRQSGKNAGQVERSVKIDRSGDPAAREAYYGGRVQILGPAGVRIPEVISYDCNSMYPTMMLEHPLPDPTAIRRTETNFESVRERGFLYWGEFILDGSDAEDHFLPGTNDEGRRNYSGRTFDGWLCSPEVEYALSVGWTIVGVGEVFYTESTVSPFAEYVRRIYGVRMEWKRAGDSRELFAKILLNALYGLFGTRGLPDRIEALDDVVAKMAEDGWESDWDVKWWSASSDEVYLESREAGRPPEYTYPAWASFITSYARVHLARSIAAIRESGRTPLYCDTDSIHFAGGDDGVPLDIGSALGQWLPEGDLCDGVYWEPKVYTQYELGSDEPSKIKHKGCNRSTGDCRVPQATEGVVQYRTALRLGLDAGSSRTVIKRSRRWCK